MRICLTANLAASADRFRVGAPLPRCARRSGAVLDKSQRTEKYNEADSLQHAGIPTFIDAKHAISHSKVMIIDAATVITGSFNFTEAAEGDNAENLLVIDDPSLATKYGSNWEAHLKHSDKYVGKPQPKQQR